MRDNGPITTNEVPVEAVARIGGKVGEIDTVSATIAAAMEQQNAAT